MPHTGDGVGREHNHRQNRTGIRRRRRARRYPLPPYAGWPDHARSCPRKPARRPHCSHRRPRDRKRRSRPRPLPLKKSRTQTSGRPSPNPAGSRTPTPSRTATTRRDRRRKQVQARQLALVTLAAAATVAGCVLAAPAGRAEPVTVFPTPGSRMATPQTQIVFRGVPVSRLGSVVVTGSRSGRHRGRLVADSDGHGGSFLPSRPFLAGEEVTVRVRSHLLLRGRSFSFRVATAAGPIPDVPLPAASRAPDDVRTFHSRPDLAPP